MASVLPATENVKRQIRLVESSPCHTQSENEQKRRRNTKPLPLDKLFPVYLPASSLSPKDIGALAGSYPIHGKFYRSHGRYACFTHTTPSVRFASRVWFLFRGLLQSIMKIAISQSPSRPSSRPSTSLSSRYMTADVE